MYKCGKKLVPFVQQEMAPFCGYCLENSMDKQNDKRKQQEEQQTGSMSSYNNRQDNREGNVEETSGGKDESQSYMDYNGNSEENAPARAKENNNQ
jgi:hypothetical protein